MPQQLFPDTTPTLPESQVFLERERINRLLGEAVQKPIVNIIAGAGCGKTRSVHAFAKTSGLVPVWIQLSEQDNRTEHFWQNFTAAVSASSKSAAEKLRLVGSPATEKQFEKLLPLFKDEFIPGKKNLFVFDDLHFINGGEPLSFLERFITMPLYGLCSILISRSELCLKAAEKRSIRVTGEELRFTQDEMLSYFELLRVNVSPQTASAIYRDTEGWAFAINLAARSLKSESSGAAYLPKALRSNAFRLVESELMPSVSPELKKFLIKLSTIEHLAPDLLKEIAGDRSLVNEMEKITSFVSFDPCLNSYRIHTIFLEYLREHQIELSAEEKKEVWIKTARWSAANKRRKDALINFEKIRDYNGIIGVLSTLPMVLPTEAAVFILELLDRQPETLYRDYPKIFPIRIRALISLARYEQARAELLEKLPALKALPESCGKHRILLLCYMSLGFVEFIFSTYSKRYDFIPFFKMAAGESRMIGNAEGTLVNGISIGFHACRVIDPSPGEIEKFIEAVGEMVPYSSAALKGCQYGMYELVQGEYAFFRGSLADAEELLKQAAQMGREKEQYEIHNRALFYLLRLYLSRGNVNEVKNVLKSLEAELSMPFCYSRHFQYDIVTGWYYIQTGKKNLLASWLKSDYEESELNSRSRGLEKLLKAKYYLAEKRYPAALASLENNKNLEIFVMGSVEMKALEAVCRYKLADREGAFKALGEAYRLASPAGLFMPFTELGKDMRSLADAAARDNAAGLPQEWLHALRRNAAAYAKKLYPQTENPCVYSEQGMGPPLSHRETDILVGLSRGLTREEIADASLISPNTVKSVTRSIYNKLGALNRADAVRIAAQRGLLS